MEKKELYEKFKQYIVPCVANYYEEPLILDRGRGNTSMTSMGKNISIFLGVLSRSAWGIAMKRLLPKPSIK